MKAIILAAGRSSRLYPLTLDIPKCLLEISEGLSIIEFQISLLKDLNISDILVVTGFESRKIVDRLGNRVRFCHYPDFMKTNNLYTLNHIIDELNDDILVLFSDVILSKGLLEKCINSVDDFNLLIDDQEITDKTMRVLLNDRSIVDIGSHIPVDKGNGNFIGIAKYHRSGAELLREMIISLCKSQKYLNDYYTIALTEIAKIGIDIKYTLNESNYYWKEIDYLEDFLEIKNNYNKIKPKLFGAK